MMSMRRLPQRNTPTSGSSPPKSTSQHTLGRGLGIDLREKCAGSARHLARAGASQSASTAARSSGIPIQRSAAARTSNAPRPTRYCPFPVPANAPITTKAVPSTIPRLNHRSCRSRRSSNANRSCLGCLLRVTPSPAPPHTSPILFVASRTTALCGVRFGRFPDGDLAVAHYKPLTVGPRSRTGGSGSRMRSRLDSHVLHERVGDDVRVGQRLPVERDVTEGHVPDGVGRVEPMKLDPERIARGVDVRKTHVLDVAPLRVRVPTSFPIQSEISFRDSSTRMLVNRTLRMCEASQW